MHMHAYPMRYEQQYTPIIPKMRDWPVVQLNKRHQDFLQTVIDTTVQTILSTHQEPDILRTMLIKTARVELARIQKTTWRIDAPDESYFWGDLHKTLTEQPPLALPAILNTVVQRYANEITGRFRMSHYQLGQRAVTYALGKWLNSVSLKRLCSPWRMRTQLQEKILIQGAVKQIRELAKIGTLVMVPTHFSHFDSLLMAWVIHTLGLPHFIYGAGRNLFNSKFFAYFMNNLGTYKVDRRKKNLPYLTTLKTYANLTLQWGCHSLFYPGGTRSRSGALEQRLKLGLLSTALEAQQANYKAQGRAARKIFIVPVVLNYHCVPEAPRLIKHHLMIQGLVSVQSASPYQLFKAVNNFLTKDSNIIVSIGKAMDLLGNAVDEAGNSYNTEGICVDTYQQFLNMNPSSTTTGTQYENCTRALGKAIVAAYYRTNCVLTSHLVAFAAFVLIKQQHINTPLQDLLQLPPEKTKVAYTALHCTFAQLRSVILDLYQAGKVQVEPALTMTDISTMLQQGLNQLGRYHSRRPLLQNRCGDVFTQDLNILFYYHNRLKGYALEKHIS